MGTTKHMGGQETTERLIELCHIDGNTHILDVGCGAGATASYLIKTHGCTVVGVDIRESMVALAQERAGREGLVDRIEFRVADARNLPFEANSFDAVLCESVATFVVEKQQVANELARVTRTGGYVGLNEEIWLRPPPADLSRAARQLWEIEPELPTIGDWQQILESVGLQGITVETYQFDSRRESSQIKRYRFGDMWRMIHRTGSLYFKSRAFREYMKKRQRLPKKVFKYLGYALLVGQK
jgi:ubiquinone/menaquinone biosynthesis C-methylase UbiE